MVSDGSPEPERLWCGIGADDAIAGGGMPVTGFPDKEYYRNQYYGAVDWITQSGPSFVRLFTDACSASDEKAKRKLTSLRYKLVSVWALRYPAVVVESRLRKRSRTVRDYIFLTLGLPLYPFSKVMDSYLKGKALDEWQNRKTERNGSEMYLLFKR